jgi:hypothetical protein
MEREEGVGGRKRGPREGEMYRVEYRNVERQRKRER